MLSLESLTFCLSKIHKKLNTGLAGLKRLYVRVLSFPHYIFMNIKSFCIGAKAYVQENFVVASNQSENGIVLPLFNTSNAFRTLCSMNVNFRNLEEVASINIEIQIKTHFTLALSGSCANI